MPASHLTISASRSGGSFILGDVSHNRHRFSHARDNTLRPYPSAQNVYIRSDLHDPDTDSFNDLGLSDFFVAHRRVARRKLERLQLSPFQAGLFSRGSQIGLDRQEPYHEVLEASIGYHWGQGGIYPVGTWWVCCDF